MENCYVTQSGKIMAFKGLEIEYMKNWLKPITQREKVDVVMKCDYQRAEKKIVYQKRTKINFSMIYREIGHKKPKQNNSRVNVRPLNIGGPMNFSRIYQELGHPSMKRKTKLWGA